MLTQARLKELLTYNPETGAFIWLKNKGNRRKGLAAGGPNGAGYILIGIDGVRYGAHRLAWFYVFGVWPTNQIDHKDLNKNNNKLENLRDVTPSQNQFNRLIQSNNTTGFRGIAYNSKTGLYEARGYLRGKIYPLGNRKTLQEARILREQWDAEHKLYAV